MRWAALIVGVLSVVAWPALGADLSIQASVDKRTVGLGQELLLTVAVGGGFQSLPSPRLPEMGNFNVYPSGTSTNFSFTNGRVTSSKISRYVLVPKKEGALTIPPIAVEHKGREYLTDAIEITVTAASTPPPDAPQAPQGVSGGDLLLKASLDKRRAYVGEQVTLTMRFYRRAALVSSRVTPPATTGFWVEELPGEKNYYSLDDGLQYQVTEIAMALFPTTDGILEVGPATWECVIRERLGASGRAPFDLFARGFAGSRNVTMRSDALELEVMPLPESGRPGGFKSAVGRFEVTSRVDRAKLRAEEPLTFTVRLSGVGNISALSDLDMPEMPNFRSYDSGGSTELSKDGGEVQGSKSFSRVYIPSVPGEYVIPPVSLPYFDPSQGRYAVASSKGIELVVGVGEGGQVAATGGGSPGDIYAKDIRYIKTEVPSFSRSGDRLYTHRPFLLVQLIAPVMIVCAYVYRAARERAGRDPARVRARGARREAAARLSRARALVGGKEGEMVWKALAFAMRNYVADVTDASASGLTNEEIRERLGAIGITEDLIGETLDTLEGCDAASFAPHGGTVAVPENAVRAARDIIGRLEKMRKNR